MDAEKMVSEKSYRAQEPVERRARGLREGMRDRLIGTDAVEP